MKILLFQLYWRSTYCWCMYSCRCSSLSTLLKINTLRSFESIFTAESDGVLSTLLKINTFILHRHLQVFGFVLSTLLKINTRRLQIGMVCTLSLSFNSIEDQQETCWPRAVALFPTSFNSIEDQLFMVSGISINVLILLSTLLKINAGMLSLAIGYGKYLSTLLKINLQYH